MHHSSLPSPGLHIVHYSLWWVLWSLMRKQLVPVLGEAAVAWSVTASNPLNISPSLWKAAAAFSLLRTEPSPSPPPSPLSRVSVSAAPPPTPSQLWSHRDSGHSVTSHCIPLIEMRVQQPSRLSAGQGRLPRRLGAGGGITRTHHPSLPLFPPIIDTVNVNKTVCPTDSVVNTNNTKLTVNIDWFDFRLLCSLQISEIYRTRCTTSWSFLELFPFLYFYVGCESWITHDIRNIIWSDTFALWPSLLILKCVCK